MAFPAITDTATSEEDTATLTHGMLMPTTIASGNFIVAICAVNSNNTDPIVTGPTDTGWATIKLLDARNTFYCVFVKVADGTEGATTVNFTTDIIEESAHIVYTGDTWLGSLSGIVISTGASANDLNPDPDIVNTTWELNDNLFLATCTAHRNNNIVAWPTNYTANQLENDASSGGGLSLAAGASYAVAAEAEDPSSFTLVEVRWWGACTIAIAPAGAIFETDIPQTKLSVSLGIGIGL